MTTAILAIVATLVTALTPLLAKWLWQKFNQRNDPGFQRKKAHEEIDQAIATGDEAAVNDLLKHNLDRLQAPRGSISRPSDNPPPSQ